MADTTYPVDEYDRICYPYDVVPPISERIAVWRGHVVSGDLPDPSSTISGSHKSLRCTHGWIESGDWWLHCPECHPYTEESMAKYAAKLRSFNAMQWVLELIPPGGQKR